MILCNANNETKLYDNIENVPFEKHINISERLKIFLKIQKVLMMNLLPWKMLLINFMYFL